MVRKGSFHIGFYLHTANVHFTYTWERTVVAIWAKDIETVSPEGTFCDTVQIPAGADNMELI